MKDSEQDPLCEAPVDLRKTEFIEMRPFPSNKLYEGSRQRESRQDDSDSLASCRLHERDLAPQLNGGRMAVAARSRSAATATVQRGGQTSRNHDSSGLLPSHETSR